MRKIIDIITRNALIFMMGILVIVVVWQVFSRYILNAPSTNTDELARFLLIWISLLGAAYFSGKNAHIAINVLPKRLRPQQQKILRIIINLIIISFVLAVFVIGGGILVYYTIAYLQLTPTLQIPMALVYLIGPISGILIVYYKLSDINNLLKTSPDSPTESAKFNRTSIDESNL